jgi:hypothetical protein
VAKVSGLTNPKRTKTPGRQQGSPVAIAPLAIRFLCPLSVITIRKLFET